MENYSGTQFVNIGTGEDLTIRELALLIKSITGYEGEIVFDTTKPEGTPRKLMDVGNFPGWDGSTGSSLKMA